MNAASAAASGAPPAETLAGVPALAAASTGFDGIVEPPAAGVIALVPEGVVDVPAVGSDEPDMPLVPPLRGPLPSESGMPMLGLLAVPGPGAGSSLRLHAVRPAAANASVAATAVNLDWFRFMTDPFA
jgi:hypothetical protein